MSDLPALLKRLETVTTRLEDLASKGGPVAAGPKANGTAESHSSSGVTSPSLDAFDEILSGPVKTFVDLSAKVGGLVNDQVCSGF
jgi:hypothetical protein